MLQARGYIVPQLTEEKFVEEFTDVTSGLIDFDKAMCMLVRHTLDRDRRILVLCDSGLPQLGIGELRKVIDDRLSEYEGLSHCILITPTGKATPQAKTLIQTMADNTEKPVTIELFPQASFAVNISEHRLVSTHSISSAITGTRFVAGSTPRISVSDPQAKYLGLRHGDFTDVNRPSESAGRYKNIRRAICTDVVFDGKKPPAMKKRAKE